MIKKTILFVLLLLSSLGYCSAKSSKQINNKFYKELTKQTEGDFSPLQLAGTIYKERREIKSVDEGYLLQLNSGELRLNNTTIITKGPFYGGGKRYIASELICHTIANQPNYHYWDPPLCEYVAP